MAENSFQPFTRRQTMIRRDFEIYRYRYMDEVELHHHDFYEIYMLLRGSVSYTVENRIFHMRAGDLMLISPLELHQARVDSNDEPYERIVLWVDRGYLESLSSPHTSLTRCFDTTVPGHTNLLRLPGPRSAEMRRELDKLRSLHMQESYGSDLLAVCSLVELMVAINQSAADRSMQSALSADMASDRVVDGVLSYINEHTAQGYPARRADGYTAIRADPYVQVAHPAARQFIFDPARNAALWVWLVHLPTSRLSC